MGFYFFIFLKNHCNVFTLSKAWTQGAGGGGGGTSRPLGYSLLAF
jgi:hypothetical protein